MLRPLALGNRAMQTSLKFRALFCIKKSNLVQPRAPSKRYKTEQKKPRQDNIEGASVFEFWVWSRCLRATDNEQLWLLGETVLQCCLYPLNKFEIWGKLLAAMGKKRPKLVDDDYPISVPVGKRRRSSARSPLANEVCFHVSVTWTWSWGCEWRRKCVFRWTMLKLLNGREWPAPRRDRRHWKRTIPMISFLGDRQGIVRSLCL